MLPKCLTVLCCCGLSPQASICRSSQPLSGFSARCLEDEQMLQAIRKANPRSDFIYVVDTRPKVSVSIFVHVSAALRPEAGKNQSLTDISHCSWSDETCGNQGAAIWCISAPEGAQCAECVFISRFYCAGCTVNGLLFSFISSMACELNVSSAIQDRIGENKNLTKKK